MKTSLRLLIAATALCFTVAFTPQAGAELLGHKGLAGQALDKDSIKAVLLGKKATLGDTRVIIVIVKKSDTQDAFLKDHVGMTTDQFNTYWRRLFMTGGGSAPKTVETEEDAYKLVAETPGAIVIMDAAKGEGLTTLAK